MSAIIGPTAHAPVPIQETTVSKEIENIFLPDFSEPQITVVNKPTPPPRSKCMKGGRGISGKRRSY